jgi:hypothetical protein
MPADGREVDAGLDDPHFFYSSKALINAEAVLKGTNWFAG